MVGGGVVGMGGGQGGCEQRSEAFVKIQNKIGGGVGGGGGGRVFVKIQKKIFFFFFFGGGGGSGGGGVRSGDGVGRWSSKVWCRWGMWGMGDVNQE